MQTLKPRVATLDARISKRILAPESWRALKTSDERGYTAAWRKARARFLKENPLCVYCRRQGRITAASVVDHITPHKGDMVLFWDVNNWQSLCAPCHDSTKKREENAARKNNNA